MHTTRGTFQKGTKEWILDGKYEQSCDFHVRLLRCVSKKKQKPAKHCYLLTFSHAYFKISYASKLQIDLT